jgi:hypothetical protein
LIHLDSYPHTTTACDYFAVRAACAKVI